MKIALTIIGVVLGIVLIGSLLGGAALMFGFAGFARFGMWYFILRMLGSIAFWGLLILAIVWLGTGLASAHRGTGTAETPMEILKSRYAKGEITKEQYEEMKQTVAA